jgi:hypothetical protein
LAGKSFHRDYLAGPNLSLAGHAENGSTGIRVPEDFSELLT